MFDAVPLLAAYDDRYADAPIDARRVFEAELATGAEGPIRSMRGGPNWSILIAAVMALVLAWSIARLIMDSPVELSPTSRCSTAPPSSRRPSPRPRRTLVLLWTLAPVGPPTSWCATVPARPCSTATSPFGEKRTVKAAPPVRVQSSDGNAIPVQVDGHDRGPLGAAGSTARAPSGPRRLTGAGSGAPTCVKWRAEV